MVRWKARGLVAIWFPFWHLSVLWALLTLPTLVSSAIKTGRHAYVCRGWGRNAGDWLGLPTRWLGTLGSGGPGWTRGHQGIRLEPPPHPSPGVDKDTVLKSLPGLGPQFHLGVKMPGSWIRLAGTKDPPRSDHLPSQTPKKIPGGAEGMQRFLFRMETRKARAAPSRPPQTPGASLGSVGRGARGRL